MSVLSDSEYESLRPYFDVIRKYKEVGQEVSTGARPTMATVYMRVHNEPACLNCSGAISRLYELMNYYLDEYETKTETK